MSFLICINCWTFALVLETRLTCTLVKDLLTSSNGARGSCYRWWVRFTTVLQQLCLVIETSCKPGFSGTEVKHSWKEWKVFLLCFFEDRKWRCFIFCLAAAAWSGYRTWSRAKGNFSRGFLEAPLGWTCANCIWAREALNAVASQRTAVWQSLLEMGRSWSTLSFFENSSRSESHEQFFLILSKSHR